jgi:hypothetical protein
MTKRRWILLIVVLVLGGAFVVDRMFLGGPESAEAKPVSTKPPKVRTNTSTAKQPTAAPVANDPSLAWLEKLAEPRPGRDVFAPSPTWIQAQKDAVEKTKARSEQQQGPKPGSPEAFEAAHRLQATTMMENGGIAVVDGQCLSVGDMLEDFQLTRVQAAEAEFRRGHEYAVLRLPMGPASKAKTPPAPGTKRKAPSATQSSGPGQ